MILYIPKGEKEALVKVLQEENIAYDISAVTSIRELGTGSYEMLTIQANVAEVEVPPRYRSSEGDVRAFRLPSGRLILTDLEGNLDRIETPPPSA